MIETLFHFFVRMVLTSILSFGGGAQALFYDFAVVQTQWISSLDLSAMLAFGYATPGPAVFATATFIGYHLYGLMGAIVGSIGIFCVPWFLGIFTAKYFNSWLDHPHAPYLIKGVGLAAAGVVASTALNLLPSNITTNMALLLIMIGAFAGVAFWKVNPLYILVVGGIVGILVK